MNSRPDNSLADLEATLSQASPEQLSKLLGELARLQALGFARLATASNGHNAEEPDQLLTAEEASDRLGTSKDFLYRAKGLPFRVRVGRRVRFSARGIERYIRQRQGR